MSHHVDDGKEDETKVCLAVRHTAGVQSGAQKERGDHSRHHADLEASTTLSPALTSTLFVHSRLARYSMPRASTESSKKEKIKQPKGGKRAMQKPYGCGKGALDGWPGEHEISAWEDGHAWQVRKM